MRPVLTQFDVPNTARVIAMLLFVGFASVGCMFGLIASYSLFSRRPQPWQAAGFGGVAIAIGVGLAVAPFTSDLPDGFCVFAAPPLLFGVLAEVRFLQFMRWL